MAGFVFQPLKRAIAAGEVPWGDVDLEVGLLLINAAASFDPDPTLDDLDAIDAEIDVPGYARQDVTGRTVERDDGEVLARWLADDVVFPTVGPGANVGGAVLFIETMPGLWLPDVAGTLNGTDYTVTLDPLGVLRFRDPA